MIYEELISQMSEELSLPTDTIKNVLDSYLNVIKNSIESEKDKTLFFESPILNIRSKTISKNRKKRGEKRGVIIITND